MTIIECPEKHRVIIGKRAMKKKKQRYYCPYCKRYARTDGSW